MDLVSIGIESVLTIQMVALSFSILARRCRYVRISHGGTQGSRKGQPCVLGCTRVKKGRTKLPYRKDCFHDEYIPRTKSEISVKVHSHPKCQSSYHDDQPHKPLNHMHDRYG